MTSSTQAYNYVVEMIKQADTYFAFKCVDYCIDHFGRCFTEYNGMKKELIDLRCDRWKEFSNVLYKKPNP